MRFCHGRLRTFCALAFIVALAGATLAAPKAQRWERWEKHNPKSVLRVDHSAWKEFLVRYLMDRHPSGISRIKYSEVSPQDRNRLNRYLERLENTAVSKLDRDEQKAFWINLYNALTVRVVLEHYPVRSIRDIDISPGLFANGPWGAKLVRVEDTPLSLNDIEHRILRPLWQDNRIHYAVNCASLGCPNLQPEPFTAANLEVLLEKGAREYVNHPRGVTVVSGQLRVSSIYIWFRDDFGGSDQGILTHLTRYATPSLRDALQAVSGRIRDEYDWRLNQP